MTALAAFRTRLDDTLATAVDSSTWTNTIKDEAFRHGLGELDNMLVYEDSFTVVSTSYEQTISITDLKSILALAYPWSDGYEWARAIATWRIKTPPNVVVFTHWQPAADEVIRVRFNKSHKIQDLDAAASTTVPDQYDTILTLLAAVHACEMRARQITENPAIPNFAGNRLVEHAMNYRKQAAQLFTHMPANQPANWSNYGL